MYLHPTEVSSFLENKGTKFLSATVRKNNGEVRKYTGLLHAYSRMKDETNEHPIPKYNGTVHLYLPSEGRWVSFRTSRVISLK